MKKMLLLLTFSFGLFLVNTNAQTTTKQMTKKECQELCKSGKIADVAKMLNCDPSNCDPKNCDPKNCDPKNCDPGSCVIMKTTDAKVKTVANQKPAEKIAKTKSCEPKSCASSCKKSEGKKVNVTPAPKKETSTTKSI